MCINGQIDDNTASLVVAQLLFLEADHPDRPISLYINSPGGYVTSGLAIYDTMQASVFYLSIVFLYSISDILIHLSSVYQIPRAHGLRGAGGVHGQLVVDGR